MRNAGRHRLSRIRTATRLPRSGNAALAAGALIQAALGAEFVFDGLSKVVDPDYTQQFRDFVQDSAGANSGPLSALVHTLVVPNIDVVAQLARFTELIAGDRSQIKGLLRDQSKIAGIGNAYSDDILHAAKLSPFKPAANLDDAEVQQLYDAIRGVLTDAVERARGLAAGDLKAEKKLGMRVHGRSGQPCPVCGDEIRSVSFADSRLEYCPTCQTGGKPLADRRLSRLLK